APSGSTSTAFRVRFATSTAIGPPILEVVRHQALCAERVPDAEEEAREPDHGDDLPERAAAEGAPHGETDAGREDGHRERRAGGEEAERSNGERVIRDRREEKDPDAGAAADAVDDADGACLP